MAPLTTTEKRLVLALARRALEAAVRETPLPAVAPDDLPAALTRPASCFVTLTCGGELRGCIGGLAAGQPLYHEVQQRAAQAACSDYRFAPIEAADLPRLEIEVSVLSEPQPLAYTSPADLVRQLRPGIDGVVLSQGWRRATFLPQVWAQVPEPERFLALLCEKLGARPDAWRRGRLEVHTYQVDHFCDAAWRAEPGIDPAVSLAPD